MGCWPLELFGNNLGSSLDPTHCIASNNPWSCCSGTGAGTCGSYNVSAMDMWSVTPAATGTYSSGLEVGGQSGINPPITGQISIEAGYYAAPILPEGTVIMNNAMTKESVIIK